MSTRLGWAGPGGGREKEERILHPGPRPAQASVPWAPTVSRPPPNASFSFLPAFYPFGKYETEAYRSVASRAVSG